MTTANEGDNDCVAQDPNKALYYLDLAEQLGHPDACDEISNLLEKEKSNLGKMSDTKEGSIKKIANATKYSKKGVPTELSSDTIQTLRLSSSDS